jgi:hypothetical protein
LYEDVLSRRGFLRNNTGVQAGARAATKRRGFATLYKKIFWFLFFHLFKILLCGYYISVRELTTRAPLELTIPLNYFLFQPTESYKITEQKP